MFQQSKYPQVPRVLCQPLSKTAEVALVSGSHGLKLVGAGAKRGIVPLSDYTTDVPDGLEPCSSNQNIHKSLEFCASLYQKQLK